MVKNALSVFCAAVLFIAGTSFHFFFLAGCPKPLPCPDPPPRVVPTKPCELPDRPTSLPVAKTVDAGVPNLFCYDTEGAMAIVERDGILRQWIKEALAQCGPKPKEIPDASSPRPEG